MSERIFISLAVCIFLIFGFPIATVPILDFIIQVVTGVNYMNPDSVIGSIGLLAYYALALATLVILVVATALSLVYKQSLVSQFLGLAGIEVFACIIGFFMIG